MAALIHIEINSGNAAFSDGNAPAELARILRGIADRISEGTTLNDFDEVRVPILDFNGNRVGSWFASEGGDNDL